MSRKARGLVALLFSFHGLRAFAEPIAPPLDVERYVALVRRSHPGGAAAAARRRTAEAERFAARLVPDPSFEVGLGRAEAHGASANERSYSLRQTLPSPFAFAAGLREADRGAELFEAEARRAEWDLEIDARRELSRLVAARGAARVLRSAAEEGDSLLALVKRRVEVGETRESEQVRAEVEALRSHLELLAAEREAEAAERGVRALVAEPLPDPLLLADETPSTPRRLVASAELGPLLRDSNPELTGARAERERRRERLAGARASRLPELDLELFREEELDKKGNGFSVGFRIPLWNANRGEIARAEAEAEEARAEETRLEIAIRRELESRLRDLSIAEAQARILHERILPAARESERIARVLFREGETSLLELLDAGRVLRRAEREEIDARLALANALAELARIVGPETVFGATDASEGGRP